MQKPWRRRAGLALPTLLALTALAALPGCKVPGVTLMLSDFDTSQVDGLRVWREDAGTGELREELAVVFTGVSETADGEVLTYQLWDGDTLIAGDIPTALERDPDQPQAATFRLDVLVVPGGRYRLSAWNAAGESQPSAEVLVL